MPLPTGYFVTRTRLPVLIPQECALTALARTGVRPPPRAAHTAVWVPGGMLIHGGASATFQMLSDTWFMELPPPVGLFTTGAATTAFPTTASTTTGAAGTTRIGTTAAATAASASGTTGTLLTSATSQLTTAPVTTGASGTSGTVSATTAPPATTGPTEQGIQGGGSSSGLPGKSLRSNVNSVGVCFASLFFN